MAADNNQVRSIVAGREGAGIAKYFFQWEIFKRICASVMPAGRTGGRRQESENKAEKVPFQSAGSIQPFLTYPPAAENIGSDPEIHLTLWGRDIHQAACIWPSPPPNALNVITGLIIDMNYTVKKLKITRYGFFTLEA
jgi:hypothetical protein